MQPRKSLATSRSDSAHDEPVDTDSRPGRSFTTLSDGHSHTRRSSQSSSRSDSRTRPPISCVSREITLGEDCAKQRFIVWAAVRRNRSVHMAASERLRCPLLRCGERFDEHEEMLRHLEKCQHLTTGEYVCYECMKVERFNDKQCTCCLGQPTKRRRIINMAKNFFSNVGSPKVRREAPSLPTYSARFGPPSYESLLVDSSDPPDHAQTRETAEQEQPVLELNGTELLELDSTSLRPRVELDAVNYNTHSTDMMDSLGSCIETPLSPPPSSLSKPRESPQTPDVLQTTTRAVESGGRRPSLALNTQLDQYRSKPRTSYLSPSTSAQPSHTISPITPWSAEWSAGSKASTMWTTVSGREAEVASPITPLSAETHPMTSQETVKSGKERCLDGLACPKDPSLFTMRCLPEFPLDDQLSSAIPRLLSDPLTSSYDPKDSFSWLSSINTEFSFDTSVNMMFTDPNTKTALQPGFLGTQVTGSDTKTLIEQVMGALGEQFSASVSRLGRMQSNPLAESFIKQTPRTVASAGLAKLKRIIYQSHDARPDPLEYLCFIHVIYSMSLVLYGNNLMTISHKLYDQAITYSTLFDTTYRDSYYQIVTTIWQEHQQDPRGQSARATNRLPGNKGKEIEYQSSSATMATTDIFVVTGQNFLDELEITMLNGSTQQPTEVLNSNLWSLHLTSNDPSLQAHTPLTITSSFIVQDLCHSYHDTEDLLQKLKGIGQSCRAGYYGTIRKLELELIRAGKNHFTSNEYLDQYDLQVRGFCNQVYSQPGNRSRMEYHSLGISLVDSMIQNSFREPQIPQGAHPDYPVVHYPWVDNFTPNWMYPIFPGSDQQGRPEEVPRFDSPIGLPIHSIPPGAQLPSNSPKPPPIRSHASETPSEYTISPTPVSDAPPDHSISNVYRPTPPSNAQSEENEASGSSTLASSGQKVEANERCEICGYRPKGDPQWFKGSMAKHKKMQHSTNPPTIFKCPYPGCNSEYKNRRDNLRQHQIEKNHFVGDEGTQPGGRKRKRRENS
ncbi:hypothetical protein F4808DRAFT_120706 [Astrocystis sublimbata]|nr:hypothetical protein F4808DRAFT_120706 [Astrocystis sublimbata]